MGSEKVINWRRRTKDRIVESMGGCCQICGYKKSTAALELHHINPEEKEISFGQQRANCMAWERIVKELRKCILLCSNCHKEIHEGSAILPEVYFRFDESFVDYKIIEVTFCPVCGKEKEKISKTCSYACAATLSGKIDWDKINIEKILAENNNNYSATGRVIGVTSSSVIKRLKKIGLYTKGVWCNGSSHSS